MTGKGSLDHQTQYSGILILPWMGVFISGTIGVEGGVLISGGWNSRVPLCIQKGE